MTGICEVMATEEVGVEEMAEGTTEWKEGVRVEDGEMDPLEMMVVVVVVVVAGDLVMVEEVVVPVLRVAHGKHLVQDLTVENVTKRVIIVMVDSKKVAGRLCPDNRFHSCEMRLLRLVYFLQNCFVCIYVFQKDIYNAF